MNWRCLRSFAKFVYLARRSSLVILGLIGRFFGRGFIFEVEEVAAVDDDGMVLLMDGGWMDGWMDGGLSSSSCMIL